MNYKGVRIRDGKIQIKRPARGNQPNKVEYHVKISKATHYSDPHLVKESHTVSVERL